jgi:hypothetical protein
MYFKLIFSTILFLTFILTPKCYIKVKCDLNCRYFHTFIYLFPGECECFDTTLQNLRVVPVNGSCLLFKEIGSPCKEHEECSALIKGPAWCHHELSTGSNFCTCAAFSVWSQELLECLPTASQGALSPCLSDLQCSAPEALGPFGKCSEVTGLCECEVALGPYSRKVRN